MTLILQVFYTLFSSVLLSLATPNEILKFGSPFIAFAALIPFYLAVKKSPNFWFAALLGFLQAFVTHILSSFWLAFFKDFALLTLGASALGTGLIASLFGALLYVPYYTQKRKNNLNLLSMSQNRTIAFRIFWFAAVYTAYEWCKSSGFLGYPWGTLSACMFRARIFMQLAAITGTYGISFLTAFFAALIGEGIFLIYSVPDLPAKKRLFSSFLNCTRFWICLFALSLCYGAVQYNIKRTPVKKLTSVFVQANENPWESKSDRNTILLCEELSEEGLKELKEENKTADLIIWSEGILRTGFPKGEKHYQDYPREKSVVKFVKEHKIPLLTGGSYIRTRKDGTKKFYNAAIVFDKEGNYRGYYPKNHLVPFAEVIPFDEFPPIRSFMEKVIGISSGWTPGDQYTFFDIPCQWYGEPVTETVKEYNLNQNYSEQKKEDNLPPTVKISAPICYDDAFPDIMGPLWKNGTEVFLNLTDDSWSLRESAEIQHFVVASYRTIEYRTPLVRTTNGGLSCVIDPAGKVLYELPMFQSTKGVFDIPVYKRKETVYARFGNWVPFILNLFIFFTLAWEMLTFEAVEYVFPEKVILLRKSRKKSEKKTDKDEKKNKSSEKAKKSKKKDSDKKEEKSSKKTKKKSDKKDSKKSEKKSDKKETKKSDKKTSSKKGKK